MTNAALFKHRLNEIISKPSVSCTLASHDMSNLDAIHVIATWLDDLGFDTEIQPLPDGKANLIACLGEGSGGLVLSGHSDTVPFDDSRWQSDPFKVEEKDNRYYGLGSCDMKAYFPVIISAIEALALKKEDLKHPLIVLATADEESSMSGARALVKESLHNARYAIIGEPTGLVPIRMHKGIAMERIRVTGKAGHSSNPNLGNNALEAMHEVIGEMLNFRSELQTRYQHPGFTVAEPTMNLGCIHGGDNPNRICGRCELDFDIRPLPGMSIDQINTELSKRLAGIAARTQTQLELEPLFEHVDPFEQQPQTEIVKMSERLSGHAAESVAFATEAPFLAQLGMQTIVMGPGSIDQAHQPNEYLEHDQIQPAIDIIKAAIVECCLEQGP